MNSGISKISKTRNLILSIVGIIVIALAVVYGWQRTQNQQATVGQKNAVGEQVTIANVQYSSDAPSALSKYFDFSGVHTFGAQTRTLADGSAQSVVGTRTGHLKENYDLILKTLNDNHFAVSENNFNNYYFTISGTLASDTITAAGFPADTATPNDEGTITFVSVNKK